MQTDRSNKQIIILPLCRQADWRDSLISKLNQSHSGPIEIDCQDWRLGCRDLVQLKNIVENAGLEINSIRSNIPETIVSASALGHQTHLTLQKKDKNLVKLEAEELNPKKLPILLFRQGTLRSGECLDAEGDLLLFGDVNPGAKISAGGDVMIWGRLRGTAHAGKSGNLHAKIAALELRPLQLRIANAVARGPDESPEPGLAEEARLESGIIVIEPVRANAFKSRQTL